MNGKNIMTKQQRLRLVITKVVLERQQMQRLLDILHLTRKLRPV